MPVNKLEAMPRIFNFVEALIVSGIGPMKLLKDRVKISTDSKLPNVVELIHLIYWNPMTTVEAMSMNSVHSKLYL